jgi:SAM-dependent methyltransferase
MTIAVFEYLRFAWQLCAGTRVRGEQQIFDERARDLTGYLLQKVPLDILDLGNGSLRPQYMLLRAAGHRVCGIDRVNQPEKVWSCLAYGVARALYRWKLGLTVRDRDCRLVCGDVKCLPFRGERFDLITSVAAFEHFLRVPDVAKELHRVLKPGGVIYARVHLFSCPSGGHNVRVAEVPLRRLPKGIDPWDHLRKRQLPIDVPLNEWRRDQYLEEFAKYFEIVKHYCAMREGEELLTPEIEAELSTYSREELTCGAYVIVARKPA